MEIKQLRAFLAVAAAHSFLGAAEQLYVTRQAVSKTVTQLEDDLGVKLFVRGQSGTELTPVSIQNARFSFTMPMQGDTAPEEFPEDSAPPADADPFAEENPFADPTPAPTREVYRV